MERPVGKCNTSHALHIACCSDKNRQAVCMRLVCLRFYETDLFRFMLCSRITRFDHGRRKDFFRGGGTRGFF